MHIIIMQVHPFKYQYQTFIPLKNSETVLLKMTSQIDRINSPKADNQNCKRDSQVGSACQNCTETHLAFGTQQVQSNMFDVKVK